MDALVFRNPRVEVAYMVYVAERNRSTSTWLRFFATLVFSMSFARSIVTVLVCILNGNYKGVAKSGVVAALTLVNAINQLSCGRKLTSSNWAASTYESDVVRLYLLMVTVLMSSTIMGRGLQPPNFLLTRAFTKALLVVAFGILEQVRLCTWLWLHPLLFCSFSLIMLDEHLVTTSIWEFMHHVALYCVFVVGLMTPAVAAVEVYSRQLFLAVHQQGPEELGPFWQAVARVFREMDTLLVNITSLRVRWQGQQRQQQQ